MRTRITSLVALIAAPRATTRGRGPDREGRRRISVTIPEIIPLLGAWLKRRDVLSTGTVSGVAGFSEDAASLYLSPGDAMEAEIERIGVLRNPVVSWEEAWKNPPA